MKKWEDLKLRGWTLVVSASLLNWACSPAVSDGGPDDSAQGGESPGDSGGAKNPSGGAGSGGKSSGGTSSGGGLNGSGGEAVGGAAVGGSGGVPIDEPATLGGPCAAIDNRVCDENDTMQQLRCKSGAWVDAGKCEGGQACDPANGSCAAIFLGCAGLEPGDSFCSDGDVIATCGPNLVSATLDDPCEGLCFAEGRTASCAPATCGDGKPHSSEACDDGNADNTDDCTEVCKPPYCGDSFTNSDEACDDGNTDNTDDCTELCKAPFCGDGFTNGLEECDDANSDDLDACTALCTATYCGDGVVNGSETCEDGNTDNTDSCTEICQAPFCGDGLVNNAEACDDGDTDNTNDCTALCSAPYCGDGFTNGDEVCDDGNADNSDTCTTLCQPPFCGDGFTSGTEACDDGNVDNSDTCTQICQAPFCGDGFVNSAEACDDANTTSTDGCTATCVWGLVQVATGTDHSCALRADGAVKCWGENLRGQLGLGDTSVRGDAPSEMGAFLPNVDLGTGRKATQLFAGQAQTCAILDDLSLKCWGYNNQGQLGLGDVASRGDAPGEMGDFLPAIDLGTERSAKTVAIGLFHTCAVLDDDSVKCWGSNQYGQLGLGNTTRRGDSAGEMGDFLAIVDLGTGRTVKALTAGNYHTCALLDDDSVKCWGNNDVGQLGRGDVVRYGDNPAEMGDALPGVDLGAGRKAQAISSGAAHVCALLDDASVKCWGQNTLGQLGLGDTALRGDAPGEMGNALPRVEVGTGVVVSALSAGWNHNCVRLSDGSGKCWGDNGGAQLGLGDLVPRGDHPFEMGDSLPAVLLGTGRAVHSLSAGWNHTCALLDDASLKCWGNNAYGQLGLEDVVHRGDQNAEMGDALPAVSLW